VRKRDLFAAALVVVLAAAAAAGFDAIGTPGGWLIGPLLVGIVASLSGLVKARVPRGLFLASQAAIGVMVAESFTPPVIASIAHEWAIVLGVVALTIGAAGLVGWALAHFGSLPAATAAWGSSPGGASGMTAMSADYGADARLVAFMQYLRVTLVVLSAGAVSRLLLPAGATIGLPGAREIALVPALETLVIAVLGAVAAIRLGVPAGAILGPMILGAVGGGSGLVRIALPTPILAVAYLVIGLYVGLLYTRSAVLHALRALPQLLASNVLLIALCGGSAALLVTTAHVDALTAYLATTPGGIDSVTAIALGSQANVPLVLAVQALRVFVIMLCGPAVARLIERTA
jgi:membrane AbrB-like protein